jgi:hypothetical protein
VLSLPDKEVVFTRVTGALRAQPSAVSFRPNGSHRLRGLTWPRGDPFPLQAFEDTNKAAPTFVGAEGPGERLVQLWHVMIGRSKFEKI